MAAEPLPGPGDPARRPPPRLLSFDELAILGTPSYLPGIERRTLPRAALCLLWGPSGSYKSFLAIDWSARLAQRHSVIYLAAEGQTGIRLRLAAWSRFHGRLPGRVYVYPFGIDLGDDLATITLGEDWARLEPILIVVDTLSHCLGDADENRSGDMMRVVRGAQRLIQLTGATVLLVHHSTKSGQTERGSGAVRAAMDVIIQSDADDGLAMVSNPKCKDDQPWAPRYYRLRRVELPDLADPDAPPGEEPPSSCVLLPSSGALRAPRGAEDITLGQAALLDLLNQPLWLGGATPTDLADSLGRPRPSVNRAASALIAARWLEPGKTLGRWAITDAGRHALEAWRTAQASPPPSPPHPLRSPAPPGRDPAAAPGHITFLSDYLRVAHIDPEAARAESVALFGADYENAAALDPDQVDRLVARLHERDLEGGGPPAPAPA